MQQRPRDGWKKNEPQLEARLQGSTGLGAVHHPAIQRLRGSEYVHHGLSRPESALPDDVLQLEQRAGKRVSAEPSFQDHPRPAYLPAADGQSPVEDRPGHGLFTARRRHGAHVAVVTAQLPR